ncbi:MAG: hypothetical protein ACE5G8_06865 [Anaerolineae bacterium]
MGNRYHLDNIRTLLVEGFTDQELQQLYYNVPDFSAAYGHLPPDANKAVLVDRLLKRAEGVSRIETILSWARARNPARYDIHHPYVQPPPDPVTRGLGRLKNWFAVAQSRQPLTWTALFLLGTLLITVLGFWLFVALFG